MDKATETAALPATSTAVRRTTPLSADVVVVGAGGAGYAAALTAARNGSSVVMIEKLGITGGDTILSGGAISVPNNYFQRRDGIEDSVEKPA